MLFLLETVFKKIDYDITNVYSNISDIIVQTAELFNMSWLRGDLYYSSKAAVRQFYTSQNAFSMRKVILVKNRLNDHTVLGILAEFIYILHL